MLLHKLLHRFCNPGLGIPRSCQFRSVIMAAQPSAANERPYNLTPLPVFGVEVHGIDLKEPISDRVVKMIKEDVTK
jgi:hypothetical protein